jgi:predicted ATPase
VEHVYGRARELCRQIGETTELFPALLGLSIYYVVRAELQSACELGEQLLVLAEGARDPVLLVEAHYVLGVSYFPRGEFAAAWDHLAQGITGYNERNHRTHVSRYGQDAGAVCLCRAALALWYLGYPDQAVEKGREALALADRLHHPFSQAYVHHWVTILQKQCGIVEQTGQRAAAFVAFSVERGFPFWPPMGRVLLGWVECERGQVEDGIALMRKALREQEELGSELGKPYFFGLLADAYGKAGRADKGLVVVDQALANVERKGQRWPEAELHQLKGELLLLTGDDGAEDSFRRALQVACHQSAKSPELRAATSLARMWRDQDRIAQARDLLAPVYAWFTEGFDTADLKEAKALLDELS